MSCFSIVVNLPNALTITTSFILTDCISIYNPLTGDIGAGQGLDRRDRSVLQGRQGNVLWTVFDFVNECCCHVVHRKMPDFWAVSFFGPHFNAYFATFPHCKINILSTILNRWRTALWSGTRTWWRPWSCATCWPTLPPPSTPLRRARSPEVCWFFYVLWIEIDLEFCWTQIDLTFYSLPLF